MRKKRGINQEFSDAAFLTEFVAEKKFAVSTDLLLALYRKTKLKIQAFT